MNLRSSALPRQNALASARLDRRPWRPIRLLLTAIACAGLVLPASAQQESSPPSQPADTVSIVDYIHQAWDTLSRSMTDCASLADPKLTTAPILYLPADVPEPPEVVAVEKQCKVRVLRLPHPIRHMGDVKESEISVPGLLYLPNKYVVPGGRFNEMYGWDSYFILLGLLRDGRVDLARGMVENFFYEIEHYGAILNANRTYYLTRSQPPFLSSMIRAVYDAETANASDADRKAADKWLARAYAYARRDHELWESEVHRAGDTGLARYFDLGEGPVPEMEDDSTYYPDVIRWLLAHPDVQTDFLVSGPEEPTGTEKTKLASTSCDVRQSKVCARAHVGRHWLSADFYRGDRAMRESGFDPSFRYGPFSGWTHHNAPVCLNSLLYKYERDLEWMAEHFGKTGDAAVWAHDAEARRAAMNKYLWNAEKGMYFDYDFMAGKQSTYVYIATLYPLWAGAADKEQAAGVEKNLALLEHPGGIAMSTTDSGTQWDLPFGWAPASWIAIDGLALAGDTKDAVRTSEEFSKTIREGYAADKTIREKYNVVSGTSHVEVTTGYKMNVVGFGWTNAVYMEMQHLIESSKAQSGSAQ
jgi:alpha,alpha-trehalase